ncbi:dephospho-CoA kinase [Pseudosulfitobacter pseudonitzschiae]|uniref:dephospho-CoA kinase n=1 Tax=Pseudosulfitobacter pseudonitzschiae TaxID=1402135 RepID=UPI001AF8109C|nr:dephospho-CoA kinase [Pseudosulfitobacter pseudonitzschiae]MBM1815625.1 dephospho-CoA kinase [Pseudosulfitobacter pseudonitzschiae]MBM1832616.1 dephospho-CoA kinase [Pseudosulfitobacter pseudonitzschiae]MBM1837484.1 dephospho-CoA kinase [Pseudosulfitobacter pseudonitzschiae]MBM1842330.1 dephospho-CoA kinase [Pseudosulfitobacter pseudonitzschiae]MBM1847198.1 dephospho-CoA kinase [Pseudosulfitobacter pseudonitzschiae]
MSFRLGLTGSIGMGKSTTAQLFAEAGCAVWDADAAVHRIYAKGGIGVEPMRALEPRAVIDDTVSRPSLRALIAEDPTLLERIEKIVHPLVGQDRQAFIDTAQADILVFDIPLLFETGGNARMDAVVCVSIPAELQQKRVMERGTMTLEQFEQIKAKQMPNDDKVARSDYVVITDTMDHARAQVQAIVNTIEAGLSNA